MWCVDIVVDLPWFVQSRGNLGEPKSRARQKIPKSDVENEFLLYGDEVAVRHLRVILHTDQNEPPHDIVNANIHRWVNLLEVASGIVAPNTATTASLGPNTSAMIVCLGEGDEHSPALQLDPKYNPPATVDYDGVARIMAIWVPDFHVHLFYLSRFLNKGLPPEVRWLNGYRALEWHFQRGSTALAKDRMYLAFLDQHGGAFDTLRRSNQDRKGVIEEIRAIAAHALLSHGGDPRTEGGSANLITKSFTALEALIMALMNQGATGNINFVPKPVAEEQRGPSPSQTR